MEAGNMVAIAIAVVSAIGAIIGAVLTYRASAKQTSVDKDTNRIDQVMNGMQKIIDNLQAENQRLASELDKMRDQLYAVRDALNKSEQSRLDAVNKLDRLMEKHETLTNSLKTKHIINGDSDV